MDGEARRKSNLWKTISRVLSGFTIVAFIIFMGLNYWLKDFRLVPLIIPIGLIYLLARYFTSKARKKRVYSYTYKQLFPFKVVLSKNGNGFNTTYLHSKIYIIDDKIAYLGSLNFTGGGTRYNYETRVRLTNRTSVRKIVEEFNHLMHEARIPEIDMQEWGGLLYRESIN